MVHVRLDQRKGLISHVQYQEEVCGVTYQEKNYLVGILPSAISTNLYLLSLLN